MSGANSKQHVHVVRGAVNDQRRSVHFADDAANISEQVRAEVRFDQRSSAVCRENDVKHDVARCVGHFSFAPSRLTRRGFYSRARFPRKPSS